MPAGKGCSVKRLEFSKEIKRQALARSKGLCEAIGRAYGFPAGHRCNAALAYGVEFDHYPIRASDGGGNSLENCAAVCIRCHRVKTRTFDVPLAAKSKRIADKRHNIRDRARPMQGSRDSPFKRRMDGRVVRRSRDG